MVVGAYLADGSVMQFETQEDADAWFDAQREEHLQNLHIQKQEAQAIANALEDIERIRLAALEDAATANQLQQQAEALVAQLNSSIAAVGSWVPSNTYRQSEMVLIRDQIRGIMETQRSLTQALADMYAYRQANDQSTATIYQSLLWVANRVVKTVENEIEFEDEGEDEVD